MTTKRPFKQQDKAKAFLLTAQLRKANQWTCPKLTLLSMATKTGSQTSKLDSSKNTFVQRTILRINRLDSLKSRFISLNPHKFFLDMAPDNVDKYLSRT